jgi:two-component system chemotaxis response regulator CheB
MGVKAIKKTGGTVIVQAPGSSEFRGMPEAALQAGCEIDFVLPLEEIAPTLLRFVGGGRET